MASVPRVAYADPMGQARVVAGDHRVGPGGVVDSVRTAVPPGAESAPESLADLADRCAARRTMMLPIQEA